MEPLSTMEALRQELSGGAGEPEADSARSTFRNLLKAVVTLELPPGVLVSERDLMQRLRCSRAALRPALIRLAELGLIRTLPRKGLVVTALDTFDVFEIYEARWAIEARVARLAATRVDEVKLALITRLAEHPPGATRDDRNWTTFLERDQRLHLAVASTAGNRYLFDALTRVLPLSSRVWHWVYATLDVAEHIRYEHDDIVAALRERDPDAAEAAVTAHVEQARDLLRELFITQLAQAG
jgi:DNA-binding GntR family transcriptional regulator